MSYKGSRSRVTDKKQFDDNFDDIFRKKGKEEKPEESEEEVETVKTLHGNAKRIYPAGKQKKTNPVRHDSTSDISTSYNVADIIEGGVS